MENTVVKQPDFLFEISWEVCNKVGGIHTVLSTKAAILERRLQEKYILIGPDIWKGTRMHPEFAEDKLLFKLWRHQMEQEGLKTKIGRWKIKGNPIAVLVDFTPLFFEKNEIFKHLWIKYKLDSLHGHWDYIEPALFGIAAGKVIECFYKNHINSTDNVVSHFHEWMTGTGLLYLNENIPQIATVFTTHATVTGRAIAGKGLALYQNLENYNPDQQAREFNISSKHSLEKIAAAHADCFTTVSFITAKECEMILGRYPDVITPNGFDVSEVPPFAEVMRKKEAARNKLLNVVEALFNQPFDNDSFLVIKSGRYEFINKGIDVFIEALKELQSRLSSGRKVIALIFVPGNQTGPRKELIDRMLQPSLGSPLPSELLTHNLQGALKDPIVAYINDVGLNSTVDGGVKVIFVPTYLDGHDGIFDMQYYDLLPGFDLAVFPSFYEPWGYTPLESLAYYIPTITTDISGFANAFKELDTADTNGLVVLERKETTSHLAAKRLAETIEFFKNQSDGEIQSARLSAHRISTHFDWVDQIKFYGDAFGIALDKSCQREESYRNKPQAFPVDYLVEPVTAPYWREISIETVLPESLSLLKELAGNLWYSWNDPAKAVFSSMDYDLWKNSHQNPIKFLQTLRYKTLNKFSIDQVFLDKLEAVGRLNEEYFGRPVSHQVTVAYFCMEYGLHNMLKLYSGGLGILAGDFLKEASDSSVPIVAVGLLYKFGYFKQRLSVHGDQLVEEDTMNFAELPIQLVHDDLNQPILILLPFPGRTVSAQLWKVEVGRISLYLLDTFIDSNTGEDKMITSQLYGGNLENRLKQEIVLGMGGVQALNLLGLQPEVYHCNEGHTAFVGIARMQHLVLGENLSFNEAIEVVRSTSLFTTHTSVPAGIDKYTEELMRLYFSHVVKQFNISWEKFMNLGRVSDEKQPELFSMTNLALRLCQEVNAVSKIHRVVSCNLFKNVWRGYLPEELPIGYVTNGVHYDTWAAEGWKSIHRNYFGDNYLQDSSLWQKIEAVPDSEIWNTNLLLKRELLNAVRERLAETMSARHESPGKIRQAIEHLKEEAMVIAFAKRFVTYKRPELLFLDINRLSKLLSDETKPVLLLFAGKSHPQDNESIVHIKKIVQTSLHKDLANKVFFLEDYDINLAKLLVQGADLWLNTPDRNQEASGTSGMKALLNGTLNFSVRDGWWAEAYNGTIGWALEAEKEYERQDYQNDLDSDKIYKTLENEIIPMFFSRNDENLPMDWIRMVKNSMASTPQYLMGRMLKEYVDKYYYPLKQRGVNIKTDNYALAKDLAAWKHHVRKNWNDLDVLSITPDQLDFRDKELEIELELTLGDFKVEEIGAELIAVKKDSVDGEQKEVKTFELAMGDSDRGRKVFKGKIGKLLPGNYQYGFRIFPKNVHLANRLDFPMVKWI
ncbi:alpha-glucan family phosphorylase [Algoriphagus sp. AGSA1]|uniref:alpha-glucan family phosphorylase n=1 Tax=Algoriphagus sp. AGSA1 TaxID=2907213 RepID=UPI001F1C9944|nr:alpha-glucan family phosphorylase [Algoriphagus sp. AGSA1]MCE7054240.1 alpha-glucan family phosphorylase [Algoriphagus sp. AGSA1]